MNTPEDNNTEENAPEEGAAENAPRDGASENPSEENAGGPDNGDGGTADASDEKSNAGSDGRAEGRGPDRRPLGYWLRVVDARLTREFRTVFEADGLDRRDWMLLNAIAGTVDRGPVAARLERGGRRLRALVDRGWVDGSPGSWTLTDEGRMAFERLTAKVADFRARVVRRRVAGRLRDHARDPRGDRRRTRGGRRRLRPAPRSRTRLRTRFRLGSRSPRLRSRVRPRFRSGLRPGLRPWIPRRRARRG